MALHEGQRQAAGNRRGAQGEDINLQPHFFEHFLGFQEIKKRIIAGEYHLPRKCFLQDSVTLDGYDLPYHGIEIGTNGLMCSYMHPIRQGTPPFDEFRRLLKEGKLLWPKEMYVGKFVGWSNVD